MKTLVFDFDGTLTKKSNEIWSKMWTALDALEADERLYKMYKDKEIDYNEWCVLIEKEYIKRGFNEDLLYSLGTNIEMMDHLRETLKVLKDNDYHMYIISGGVDKLIYNKLGDLASYFDDIYACGFEFDQNGMLEHIISTPYDDEGKKLFIEEHCKKTGTKPNEITFIGNGDNDEWVYLSGCHTLCINPTKHTNHTNKEIWHNVIENSTDMRDILKYLDIVIKTK